MNLLSKSIIIIFFSVLVANKSSLAMEPYKNTEKLGRVKKERVVRSTILKATDINNQIHKINPLKSKTNCLA